MRNRFAYAGFGILATLVGVATGHFVASLLNPSSSPVLAVGSQVIDLTPTPMKEWAIRQFGTHDKTILVGSVFLGVLVFAAIGGLLARKRFVLGAALLVLLVAIAGYTALSRPAAGVQDAIPALATAVVGVGALWLLDRTWRRAPLTGSAPSEDTHGEARGASRRGVLVAAGALAAAAAVLGGAGRWITSYRTRPENIDLPAAKDPAPKLPAGLDEKVPGISPFRTPTKDFYRVDTRLTLPVVTSQGWSLTIDGDVDNEVSFSYDDLLAMDLMERDITLTCVSNDVGGKYLGAARWLGVPLKDLLDKAGIDSTKADQLLSTDVDGMTIGTPLDVALDGRDSMIAVGMNGAPLPREHGFPARMIVPGLYGFVSATKWITRMTLTTYAEQDSYWTKKDWATDAPIKISSRIDTPKPLSTIDPGRTVIGGLAWAQHQGGISKVEVRVDGGAWQEARMGPTGGQDYWRQWYLPWTAEKGQHSLAVRAISGDDEKQTAARATPFPDGSSGIQEIVVTVA
ncbi:molybdopterin-dependent oxidoreductase [Nocardioides sp. KIGAM211]|uniref:Molybdopterin-dependent oxidoreductase n=1 Tax=Nocardioides luti TaxID=2761101 RepID=A0A7X0RGX3_9ACTN|nr:molybdopterin-dependent oxidoreductase [Nocardioides luti]MBB6628104.1 molybdopterin-dependent oxidoreductase [Nocardioides luti]